MDLVPLTPQGDCRAFLQGLRLQSLDSLDIDRLDEYAARWHGSKALRAARIVRELARVEAEEHDPL